MTYPDKPAGGWRGLFSPAHRAIAIIITASIALYSANVYMTSAVMPSVADDIGGLSLYAWVTGVFVLATVLGSTATATLLARLGTRRAYRLAMLVFGAGTALCAVAPSMPVLLVGRFVQGLGGGLLFGLAYSLVHLVLPERLWAYAMSLMSAAWGIGTFSGPALGGTFAQVDQWRLTFWILVPVVLFFTAWGGAGLPVGAGRSQRPAAAPLTSVALLGAAVLALSLAGVSTAPEVNAAGLAGAFVLLWVWLRHERSTDTRLFPASMFAPDARLRWLYATMALLVVGATPEVFLPYFAQRLQDLGPLAAGYLGTAMAAGWTAASVLLGAVTERREVLLRVAPAVSLAGLALLVPIGPTGGDDAALIAGIALGFVLLGCGIGTAWPHLVTAVLTAVPAGEADVAGSSVTTVQLTAAAAGAAIGGLVVNVAGFVDPGGAAGTHDAALWLYIAMLAAPALALLTAARYLRRAEYPGPVASGYSVGQES